MHKDYWSLVRFPFSENCLPPLFADRDWLPDLRHSCSGFPEFTTLVGFLGGVRWDGVAEATSTALSVN